MSTPTGLGNPDTSPNKVAEITRSTDPNPKSLLDLDDYLELAGRKDGETAANHGIINTEKRRGRKRTLSCNPPSPAKVNRRFDVGELVFARVRGHPYWPARVEEVVMATKMGNTSPDSKNLSCTKYKVFFYGTHDYGICGASDICPDSDMKRLEMRERYKRHMMQMAIDEMEMSPHAVFEEPPPKKVAPRPEKKICSSKPKLQPPKKKALPRNKFGCREYFFGEFYDAGVRRSELENKSLKPIFFIRKPREEGAEDHDIEDISEEAFAETCQRVEESNKILRSLPREELEKITVL